jgi:ADP-heptose:LPS heptosyltransferase
MNLLIFAPSKIQNVAYIVPALKRIKEHYHSIFVSIIANQTAKQMLEFTKLYDEINPWMQNLSGIKAFWFLKKRVLRKHYDYVIFFEPNLSIAFSLRLLGFSNLIGPIDGWWSKILFRQGLAQYREHGLKHESEFNLELLNQIGLEYTKSNLVLQQSFDFSQLASERVDQKYIIFAATTNNQFPNWSSRNFARLINRMIENNFLLNIVYLYDENEKSYNHGFFDEINKRAELFKQISISKTPRQSLKIESLMKLIYDAEVVVGHNNDDLQLTGFLNRKLVGLNLPLASFSLKRTSPKVVNPHNMEMLVPQVVCGEIEHCSQHSCPYYECMAKIEVESVFKSIKNVLSKG